MGCIAPGVSASQLETTTFCELEPLFGYAAWSNAGFLAPTFEQDELSSIASSSHASPQFDTESTPIDVALESLENTSSQVPVSCGRTKRLPDDISDPGPELVKPLKKPRNRPCIPVVDANKIYTKAVDFLSRGGHEDLEKAYDLFLKCYRENTSYRWQGCLGMARARLQQGNEQEAFTYLNRIERGKLCPAYVKAETAELKCAYLDSAQENKNP